MKTVTPLFTSTIKSPQLKVLRQISYKRRYWNGSAYVWEAIWTALPETQVISVSPITAQLDTQTENEFQVSMTTITLINFQNQWVLSNNQSIFGADSGSPLFGYSPYWTKFQVNAGLVYPDGTTELVTLFTGVATEFNFNSTDSQVQVTVSGEQVFLSSTNAQTVSNSSTLENIGTGDGSTKVFSTDHTGVGIILNVYVAGVRKSPGTDYTISNMNSPTASATITFIVAPASSAAITCSYIYWFQGQKFETLVAALATAAGIPSGNQQIQAVTFPGSVINSHTWQTQADWQSGTLTDIDTTTLVNSIKLDFTSTDAEQLTALADSTTGWTTINPGEFDINNGGLDMGGNVGGSVAAAYHSQTSSTGRWDITFKYFPTAATQIWRWFPGANSIGSVHGSSDTPIFYGGYCVKCSQSSGTVTVNLMRVDSDTSETSLGSFTFTRDSSFHNFTFARRPNGSMVVSIDGTSEITATDTTYTSFIYIGFTVQSGNLVVCQTSKYYVPATTLTGTWISPVFDSGATPTAWQALSTTQTLNGGTVSYLNAASSDNITYDSYVAVGGGGIIGSTLKRYLKVKVVMVSTLLSANDPTASNVAVGSSTTSTIIALADFTAMTAYDAVQNLAGMANYEFGFDAYENFFFRPKSASLTPVMTIDQSTFVIDVLSQTTGIERVYSSVVVTYGSYTAEVDDPGGAPASALTTYGYNQLQPGSSGFLISADANVAAGMAQTLFNFWSQVRSEIKIATTFLPQLDLSDIITLTFHDNLPNPAWFWGDSAVYWGMPGIYYYGANNQLLDKVRCKIVGYRIDTDDWSCEYDLEEV